MAISGRERGFAIWWDGLEAWIGRQTETKKESDGKSGRGVVQCEESSCKEAGGGWAHSGWVGVTWQRTTGRVEPSAGSGRDRRMEMIAVVAVVIGVNGVVS
ncbi:hypothetical protein E2562_001227 [Oryza meyeriana var. granulata]|uniref:Uncharacterized protein n=1 Tax=Oryza meyeriana var. granulata TaxID=110450 RepID=A0A6G1DC27_9ORYZ|nr:hypothetical protein E2562_001227 [Oryza meyeriana var. granulata]